MLTLGKCCLEVGEVKQEQVKMMKEVAVDGDCFLSFANSVQNNNNDINTEGCKKLFSSASILQLTISAARRESNPTKKQNIPSLFTKSPGRSSSLCQTVNNNSHRVKN